jgi:hypothetical protein
MDTTEEAERRVRAVSQLRTFLRTTSSADAASLRLAIDVLAASYPFDAPFLAKFLLGWQAALRGVAGEADGSSRAFLQHWAVTRSSMPVLADGPEVRYLLSVGGAVGCDDADAGAATCSPLSTIQFGGLAGTWHPMAFVAGEDTYLRESARGAAMYRLSRAADGSAVTSFSSAGPPPSEIATWPQRLTAVLYVSEARGGLAAYEEHMAETQTLRIRNVVAGAPEDVTAELTGVLSIMMNSPDSGSIVPSEPAAWEEQAPQQGGDGGEQAAGLPAWAVAAIAAAGALLVGGGIVLATSKAKSKRR